MKKLLISLLLLLITSCASKKIETQWSQAYNELSILRVEYNKAYHKIREKYSYSVDGFIVPSWYPAMGCFWEDKENLEVLFNSSKDINKVRKEIFLTVLRKMPEPNHAFLNAIRSSIPSEQEKEISALQNDYIIKARALKNKYAPSLPDGKNALFPIY